MTQEPPPAGANEPPDAEATPETTVRALVTEDRLGAVLVAVNPGALELVLKGHRLIADDVVHCDYRPPGSVFGMPAPLLRHHMEIRGLGILNIRELFGVTSVRERTRIDVIVRLVKWREEDEYDRLGVDDTHESILGVPLRALTIPVRQGRDMGTLLEIAARDELLRRTGIFSTRRFVSRIERGTLGARPRTPLEPESGAAAASQGRGGHDGD